MCIKVGSIIVFVVFMICLVVWAMLEGEELAFY